MKDNGSRAEGETVMINDTRSVVPPEVTFKDFASLAERRGWTPEFLAEQFRGKIESPSEFFHRCLNGKPTWGVVIVYRSVMDFYWRELSPLLEDKEVRLCVCGCGKRAYGRKQYAGAYCRNRAYRERQAVGDPTKPEAA